MPLTFTKTDTKADPADHMASCVMWSPLCKMGALGTLTKMQRKQQQVRQAKDLVRTKGPAMKWYMALIAVLALFGIYWGYNKLEHRKRR